MSIFEMMDTRSQIPLNLGMEAYSKNGFVFSMMKDGEYFEAAYF